VSVKPLFCNSTTQKFIYKIQKYIYIYIYIYIEREREREMK
jgi:hypothetical protein